MIFQIFEQPLYDHMPEPLAFGMIFQSSSHYRGGDLYCNQHFDKHYKKAVIKLITTKILSYYNMGVIDNKV